MVKSWCRAFRNLLFLILPGTVLGTAQVSETIVLDGKECSMATEPLEEYFRGDRPRPNFASITGRMSSSCWRGYVGKWSIEDNKLHLLSLGGEDTAFEGSWDAVGASTTMGVPKSDDDPKAKVAKEKGLFAVVFPDKQSPLIADWFTGIIRVPEGNQLQYVHMGYASVHERDRFFLIVKGEVAREFTVTNEDPGGDAAHERGYFELGELALRERRPWEATPSPGAAPPQKWEWMDGEEFAKNSSELRKGIDGSIRGIIFEQSFWIPPSTRTPALEIEIQLAKGVELPAPGTGVEVRASIVGERTLEIRGIKTLSPSESLDRRGLVKAGKDSVDSSANPK